MMTPSYTIIVLALLQVSIQLEILQTMGLISGRTRLQPLELFAGVAFACNTRLTLVYERSQALRAATSSCSNTYINQKVAVC